MVKRTVLIFLILVYAVSALGISLKEFYCCGKLESVSVVLSDPGKDECGLGDESTGCCQSKYQFFKVKDSYDAPAHIEASIKYFGSVHSFISFSLPFTISVKETKIIHGIHAPPLVSDSPIYLSNKVFRI